MNQHSFEEWTNRWNLYMCVCVCLLFCNPIFQISKLTLENKDILDFQVFYFPKHKNQAQQRYPYNETRNYLILATNQQTKIYHQYSIFSQHICTWDIICSYSVFFTLKFFRSLLSVSVLFQCLLYNRSPTYEETLLQLILCLCSVLRRKFLLLLAH